MIALQHGLLPYLQDLVSANDPQSVEALLGFIDKWERSHITAPRGNISINTCAQISTQIPDSTLSNAQITTSPSASQKDNEMATAALLHKEVGILTNLLNNPNSALVQSITKAVSATLPVSAPVAPPPASQTSTDQPQFYRGRRYNNTSRYNQRSNYNTRTFRSQSPHHREVESDSPSPYCECCRIPGHSLLECNRYRQLQIKFQQYHFASSAHSSTQSNNTAPQKGN